MNYAQKRWISNSRIRNANKKTSCLNRELLIAARIARRERIALVRRGEPRFAEPSWVAGKARIGHSRINNRM